jgi:hypothetical protein
MQRTPPGPIYKSIFIEMAARAASRARYQLLSTLAAKIIVRVERTVDAVAVPPPGHGGIILGLGRNRSSLAAAGLVGIAPVQLAEH